MRRWAYMSAIVFGLVLIGGGVGTWILVSNTLDAQNITVAEDADCAKNAEVRGPYSAYCQAKIIEKHTLDSTGNRTYAELGRDDPLRQVAMNSSFLQASLFTSILAFGVAGLATLAGILFILIGLGMKDVGERLPAI